MNTVLHLSLILCAGWSSWGVGSGVKLPPIAFPKLSESYRANAGVLTPEGFRELKARKESQTDWQDLKRKSSYLYRILAFEALSKCGHMHPELVMITNDSNLPIGYAYSVDIQKNKGRGINLHESALAHEAYGVRRMIAFHEAEHIVKKDYYDNSSGKKSQEIERNADIRGVKCGGCEQCALEYAEFWFKKFHKNQSHVLQISKVVKVIPRSIDQICGWSVAYLDWFMNESKNCLYALPEVRESTHPCHLERALYVARLAKGEVRAKACEFHMPLLLKQQEKEKHQKKLLEEKKLREALKKEKEEYDARLAQHKALLAKPKTLSLKEIQAIVRTKGQRQRQHLQIARVNGASSHRGARCVRPWK